MRVFNDSVLTYGSHTVVHVAQLIQTFRLTISFICIKHLSQEQHSMKLGHTVCIGELAAEATGVLFKLSVDSVSDAERTRLLRGVTATGHGESKSLNCDDKILSSSLQCYTHRQ